jgi:DNA-binding NarL/FixJ family response regulator
MERPVRVVVANQPRLVRELVLETIREQPDIEVVAEIQNEGDIAQAVDGTNPDFLIIALSKSDKCPAICETLLHSHPQMKVLGLAPERNSSVFFWASFDIHAVPVEASEAGILDTLRGTSKVGG